LPQLTKRERERERERERGREGGREREKEKKKTAVQRPRGANAADIKPLSRDVVDVVER